ncbi:hypothetical protein SCUCBS95973_007824 [Sporothrix curviconia]|uniref:Protein phosphatase 4 core regulatory subunit R2 n=1 Tax=Sporothrix curviconia TaxID=1260050 RepID=A0ABP0CIG4_9PEZI
MDVDTDEELLQRLAAGGKIDYDHWPRLLANIISRLETIIESEYPIPIIPPPRRTQSKLPQPPLPGRDDAPNGVGVASSSRGPVINPAAAAGADGPLEGDKENADPVPGDAAATEPASSTGEGSNGNAADAAAAGTEANSSSSPSSSSAPAVWPPPASTSASTAVAAQTLPDMPKPILELIDYIMTTLKTNFSKYPPHSIQRLAELILNPRDHYRYLAPYLHAIDRVIGVTTTSNMYPLPPSAPDQEGLALLAAGITPSAGDGVENGESDLGLSVTGLALASGSTPDNSQGALLTPIPWLRRRTPSAIGDDNTTEDGSSPPSTADGSDIAFSASSSTAGSVRSGGGAGASRASSLLQQHSQTSASSSQQLLQQQQQGHPAQQHRMEVRTEATETIEGPNGMGSIETVSVSINGIPSHGAMLAAVQLQQQRGITQGELLRQEQTAGVVPVTQLARAAAARAAAAHGMAGFGDRFLGGHDDEDDEEEDEDNEMDDDDDDDMGRHALGHTPVVPSNAGPGAHLANNEQHEEDTAMGGTEADAATSTAATAAAAAEAESKGKGVADKKAEEDPEEIPHARGPEEIGAEDMGPQPRSLRTAIGTEGGGLLIGSASDATQVDMRDIDVEAAVGRKASALPAGTVAAPVIPLSSRDGVREDSVSEGEAEPSAEQRARSSTPKREAEQPLESDVPAKKRKEDPADTAAGSSQATTTSDKSVEKQADSVTESGDGLSEKTAGDLPEKGDDENPATAT